MNTELADHKRLLLECRIAAVALVTAYELHRPLTATPEEVAPQSWQDACRREETRWGARMVKFYST